MKPRNPLARNLVARRLSIVLGALNQISGFDASATAAPSPASSESVSGLESPRGPFDYLPTFGPTPQGDIYPSYLPLLEKGVAQWARKPPANGQQMYIAAQRTQLADLPRGAPPADVTVMPTWESRLVNMRDFLAMPVNDPGEGAPFAAPGVLQLSYLVPEGYIGILKRFRYHMEPIPVALFNEVLVSLFVDELPVPDFTNLPMGPDLGEYQDTFVIAKSGQSFVLRIEATVALPAVDTVYALLYGNLRLTTGAPQLAVGEKVKPAAVHVSPAPATPPLAPPVPKEAPAPAGCPSGTVPFKGNCVPCTPDTKWDEATKRCVKTLALR